MVHGYANCYRFRRASKRGRSNKKGPPQKPESRIFMRRGALSQCFGKSGYKNPLAAIKRQRGHPNDQKPRLQKFVLPRETVRLVSDFRDKQKPTDASIPITVAGLLRIFTEFPRPGLAKLTI
jgi:hypothetical protein